MNFFERSSGHYSLHVAASASLTKETGHAKRSNQAFRRGSGI